ncbi:hypothetical protein [Legionella londiniensis]|uniref:Nuclear transport factor 2 family protein n=1 Tax=Legionella londiniensis TaxID=45068 RepID=A0A0W0VKP5_9GAMM|nr:hypothetical protein [Legionella londiniensis]KTD20663.1 hypothetical protein Llon_1549 [Legionella londiniensis]STX92866.1 Uncharacterised protein [Legionella londiniensis]
MSIQKMKEMFREMVISKNAALIPYYYHQEFLLYTNEQVTNYDEFLRSHQKYYATDIQYNVAYDEEAWVEQGNKLAGRVFITTSTKDTPPQKIEVILIAHYREDKLYRLWELTYPDWSKLPAFKE